MDYRCVTCEPNFLIPQDVTIQKLKEEEKEQVAKSCITGEVVEVNARKEELQRTFSFNCNEYLKCKWNKFLEHVPKNVLIIKSYTDYKKKKHPVRRMILNGQFYLGSGKMIPIPHLKGQRT